MKLNLTQAVNPSILKGTTQTRGRSPPNSKQTKTGEKRIELKTPRSIEKHKKGLQAKLKRAMEENVRLKNQNGFLKETNQKHLEVFAIKDHINYKEKLLNSNAEREITFKILTFQSLISNLSKLEQREKFQDKNLKGLIKYAKKLMKELEEYKQKVVQAEQIISDLKKAGTDSMGNLIGMMNQFKERELNTIDEIQKLKQLTLIKDDELTNLDIEVRGLSDFLEQMNIQQNNKINSYKQQLEENKKIIRRQDKLIVDLQQKNELTQNAVAVTQDQVSKQTKEKSNLEIKMKELNDKRQYFFKNISNLEQKKITYKDLLYTQNQNNYQEQGTADKTEKRSPRQRKRQARGGGYDAQSVKSLNKSVRSAKSGKSLGSQQSPLKSNLKK